MAKSRIEQLAEKPKFTEGEIVISTQGSITVVLVTGHGEAADLFAGVRVFSGTNTSQYVGFYDDRWKKSSFVKFNGTVILEND